MFQDLWDEATKYPLLGLLHDANSYIFCCINSLAETEELIDENKRLCDIRPFSSVLKIVERKGDKAEIVLNQQISLLIGKSKSSKILCPLILKHPITLLPTLESMP